MYEVMHASKTTQVVFVPLMRGAEVELTVEAKEKRRVTSVSLGAGSEVKGRYG